jgi:hypothetical protein
VADSHARPTRPGRLELPLVPAPAGGGWLALSELSLDAQPWLADHKVIDACVFPAGGYLALIQQSLSVLSGGRTVRLRDVALPSALSLGPASVRLSGTWLPATGVTGMATIASMAEPASAWTHHCRVRACWDADGAVPRLFPEHLLDARDEVCTTVRLSGRCSGRTPRTRTPSS